jgi:leader peptidase (prepilin peptidase)/N-methyltransferase
VPPRLVVDLFAALFGLIAGSYLNVVIYRLPLGLSTATPRSACPHCGAPVRARDNLPILSFLLLGGRCRDCRATISWRYPLVEAVTAALFVAALERFGLAPAALAAAFFSCLMVALALIDLDHLLLPDRLTLSGLVVGLAAAPWLPWGGLYPALIGAATGAGVLLAVVGAWYLLRREEGMGLGDVKMLALIGAFVGWRGTLMTLFFASFAGSVVGLAMIARGEAGMRSKLPFGSFLALGGLVAMFAGREIAAWYGSLL